LDFDSGQIIDSKNGEREVPIASLTKIMTAVVALDISSPSEKFVVTKKAADQIPTKIGVIPGQHFTLQELLEAGLMTSANDAIEVIRDGIDTKYNDAVFIKAMNAKAQFLGLKHTHFTNPQGFDSVEHYSSASDLAVLTHYALTNYPLISYIVQQDYKLLPANSDHKQYDLYNWNGLLDVYPNVSGVKIGNTENAGTTTIVKSERDGKNLLVVLLGTTGVLERDLVASQLLDSGFAATLGLPPVKVTEKDLRAKYATWKYWN
jgi:D-alanyl-D-alanine carboxypeptidase